MKNRNLKRPREEALTRQECLSEHLLNQALTNKVNASNAREADLSEEAQTYFEQAKNLFTGIAAALDDQIYAQNPETNEMVLLPFDEHNQACILRYIEVITPLGEMLLEFEYCDEAEKYLLEYIKLRDHYQGHLDDYFPDSLANAFFNISVVNQTRYELTQKQSHLRNSSRWLIKALSAYREQRDRSECYDTAIHLMNNFILLGTSKKHEVTFHKGKKQFIKKVIADAISILHLHDLVNSRTLLRQFLSPKLWQKPYEQLKHMSSDQQDKSEPALVFKMQQEFTPEVFEDNETVNVARKRTKARKVAAKVNRLPAGYQLWAAPNRTPENEIPDNSVNTFSNGVPPMDFPATELSVAYCEINEDDLPSLGL